VGTLVWEEEINLNQPTQKGAKEMKMERKETINGKTVITTSEKVLFWCKIK